MVYRISLGVRGSTCRLATTRYTYVTLVRFTSTWMTLEACDFFDRTHLHWLRRNGLGYDPCREPAWSVLIQGTARMGGLLVCVDISVWNMTEPQHARTRKEDEVLQLVMSAACVPALVPPKWTSTDAKQPFPVFCFHSRNFSGPYTNERTYFNKRSWTGYSSE